MKLLYTGLPGTGKTTKLLEHYLAFKKHDFSTNGYFIVPTAEQAERITKLILQKKDCLFAKNILTFDQFIEISAGIKPLRSVAQQYILKDLLQKIPLEYFQTVKEHLSLYEYLAGLINELKIYNDSDLQYKGLKQRELQQILAAYNNYLAEKKLLDKTDLAKVCLEKLADLKFDFIILDGFTTFNDRQKEIITALSKTAHNFLAAQLALKNYQDTLDFYQNLGFQAEQLNENKRTSQPELIYLTEHYFKPVKTTAPNKILNIEVLIGNNRIIEIEQVAREILKLKEQPKYNWSDFCLIFRQIGTYQPLLQEVFDFYEVPVTIHEGLYLHKNSFISWLLQLLKLPLNKYPKEELLAVLKAGFYPVPKTTVSQLAISALHKLILDGQENWLELSKPISAELHASLSALFTKLEPIQKAATYKQIKDFIEKTVTDFDIINQLKNLINTKELIVPIKDISRAYNSFLELLTELAELQKAPETLPELLKNIEHFLTQKIITIKERQGNQVQVYDALVARQKEYKIVFLVNLTSKSVPLYIKEDLFLKDYERSYLKKSYHKQHEEEALFYLSLTRATEKLYLTYAISELNGTKIEPSPFLKKVLSLFPEKSVKQTLVKQSEAIPALNDCLTLKDLQQSLVYHLYKTHTNAELTELLSKTKDLELISEIIQKNRDIGEFAQYRAETKKILAELKEFGAKSIETLSQCRFAFLANHILKLKDQEELTLAIPAGEIIHDTLNIYYKNNKAVSLEKILEEELAKNTQKLFFLHKNQLKIELARIKQKLELFLADEKIALENRAYQPAEFELKVAKEFAGITIKARIDRIDQSENKALVIDYKTGQLPEIGISKIEAGLIPQVWLYCLLLLSAKDLEIAGCEYVQVPKNIRQGLYLESEKEALVKAKSKNILSAENMESLRKLTTRFLIDHLAAIKAGNFYTKQEKCSEYCAFKNICRMK